jgi:hypothetical protein
VIVLAVPKIFIRNKINKGGVYIKGTVIDRGGYKGGVISTVRYTFKGRVYENIVHSEGGDKVGVQYFIKILVDDLDELILLTKNPVPECLLNSKPPVEGWAQIPECR